MLQAAPTICHSPENRCSGPRRLPRWSSCKTSSCTYMATPAFQSSCRAPLRCARRMTASPLVAPGPPLNVGIGVRPTAAMLSTSAPSHGRHGHDHHVSPCASTRRKSRLRSRRSSLAAVHRRPLVSAAHDASGICLRAGPFLRAIHAVTLWARAWHESRTKGRNLARCAEQLRYLPLLLPRQP